MNIRWDANIHLRSVHVVWALVYLAVLIWSITSQPSGAWGPWIAFIALVASLVVAFLDVTKTDEVSPWGLTAILVAVLAAAFDGDSAVITLARRHQFVSVIDSVLLAITFFVLVWRGWTWDRRHKQHQGKQAPPTEEMFKQIAKDLWERP